MAPNTASPTTPPAGMACCEECGDQQFTERLIDVAAERSKPHAKRSLYARRYRAPDGYDRLCRDCLETLNTFTAETMSDDELIAAIMSDSLGYASPTHAAHHVQAFHDDETDAHCERAHACYDGDLDKLIESARTHWAMKSPDTRTQKLADLEAWRKTSNGDPIADMTLSALYPTR